MSLTNAYLITTKNLESVIDSIVSAKAPERFTGKFLERLGFKSKNDRLYIGVFKALGLLNESGRPTQRYFELIDQPQKGRVLARGIEEAYEDLFNLRKDAQNLSNEEVKNKLRTLMQGQKSECVLGTMASTFKALCMLADWGKLEEVTVVSAAGEGEQEKKANLNSYMGNCEKSTGTKLRCNIQIHLPESTNTAVYDAIFKNLKKHLACER